MTEPKPKIIKEFWYALPMCMPTDEPLTDELIAAFVRPALRRSYDKARHDDWRLAKATPPDYTMKVGPVQKTEVGYIHYFGWYVVIEVDQDEVPYSDPQVTEEHALHNES